MNLFLENGHLTDEGLAALVSGELDQLASLEAAEHLSFCDDCLVRYTTALDGEVLQEPPQSLTLPIMRRIRQRTFKVLVNRYTAAVAAVAIAGALWYSGVLTQASEALTLGQPEHEPKTTVSQKAPEMPQNNIAAAFNGWIRQATDWLKPTSKPSAPEKDPAAQAPKSEPQKDTTVQKGIKADPAPQSAQVKNPAQPLPEPSPEPKQTEGLIERFLSGLFPKE